MRRCAAKLRENNMHVVTGISGKVGGAVARTLLAAGQDVRAVVRSPAKGEVWRRQGCEVALADVYDAYALRDAFVGAESVFVLLPPTFDPSPDFSEARRMIAALRAALEVARPRKVVVLSTVGAQATRPNLLNQLGMLEQELRQLAMPVAFLRAAWFIENFAWDVDAARDSGSIPSFLQPLDRKVPMIACADVGRTAAELMQEEWHGTRVVELEAPQRMSPNDIAAGFARVLDGSVRAEVVERSQWQELFTAQGMRNPVPRMRMLDGFNEGWIEFEGGAAEQRRGRVALDTVLASLL
jgi:uncharacterized protein YbjT (DUF2867 family)